MPRNVRNFWIELEVDGKKTKVATGPRSANGGFRLTIYQRDDGGILEAIQVSGLRLPEGVLCTHATASCTEEGVSVYTKR